jgi:hypothetical protein
MASITDPNLSYADFQALAGNYGPSNGGEPPGIPSDQWGPFGVTPPPGSPAALQFWKQIQYGDSTGAIAPEFQNLAPVDPGTYTNMYEKMTANTSDYGGGMQIPVGVSGSPFNPTPGNPNYTIDPSGFGQLTPTGQTNLGDYVQQTLQGIYANARKNRSGLSGFLSGPGALSMLALPFAAAGAGAAGAGLLGAGAGGAGALGAGDVAAGVPGFFGTVGPGSDVLGLGGATTAGAGSIGADVAGGGAAAAGSGAAGSSPSILSYLTNPIGTIGGQLGLPDWATTGLRGLSALRQVASLASSLGGQSAGGGGVSAGGGTTPGAGSPLAPTLLQIIQQIAQDISRQGRGGYG